ncbi:tetratricopeptide repeat protein [Acanthopleuribacter pedis]|uniref:Tetratricopeptide repeat protein n=1 Tax=Acanthopleuribacter pedis TaxID=442870 RepID=A0A8J7U6K2_9BACT|nr:hypothetical protein [Acanthopleuribacter pedis]MBO1320466.1 hypothetical protein [Acanthopleuribacter pedis]
MEKLFNDTRAGFACFVEQRRDLMQLVQCSDNDVPVALKVLRDVEQSASSDVFLLFADPFHHPGAFVDIVLERLSEEHRLACEWLAEQQRDPIPSPPEALFDSTRTPAERLLGAIKYSRSLIPCGGGHRLVWVMFPTEIHDHGAWYGLIDSLAPHDGVQCWMRNVRLVLRDHPRAKRYRNGLAQTPRVQLFTVDFSPAALEQANRDQFEDESVPMERRMHALLQLAQRDAAYNRSEAAVRKFNQLLGYYQSTEDHGMQALVLNGLGDVHQRKNQLNRAQHYYECAVHEVTQSDSHVVFYTVVKNLGDVHFKMKDYVTAEAYYAHAEALATHLLDAEGKAQMLEKQGLAREKQRDYEGAVAHWETAVTLCRNCTMDGLLEVNLKHLKRGYKSLRQRDQASAVDQELRTIKLHPPVEV